MYTVERVRGLNTKEICTVTECMSVRSWVNLHVGPEFPTPVVCIYQGQYLLRPEWELTLIQADVVFLSAPLGGGGGGKHVGCARETGSPAQGSRPRNLPDVTFHSGGKVENRGRKSPHINRRV